jgi:predicted NBD/HSP70 family sugar kinase
LSWTLNVHTSGRLFGGNAISTIRTGLSGSPAVGRSFNASSANASQFGRLEARRNHVYEQNSSQHGRITHVLSERAGRGSIARRLLKLDAIVDRLADALTGDA